jgi:lipopolysaccharide export system protein LptA
MLLLAVGFVVFLTVYVVYAATSLGRINGLPPLPEAYLPNDNPQPIPTVKRTSLIEAKLVQAFGPDCAELKMPIRLELHSRNMVLAAGTFTVSEGKVCLVPLSVAVFGKDKHDGRGQEINSIRSKVANLTFDRPINNVSEISGRKLTLAELNGDIEIVNNRRTPERDDDLSVFIPGGPLYYNEAQHKIWTNGSIHLIDHQSKPKPHDIRGKGMEMDLLVEAQAPPPGPPGPPRKPKGDSISGVKRIVLQSGVVMNLYTGGNAGFPNPTRGTQPTPAARPPAAKPALAAGAPPPQPPAKAHVYISTPGQFQYEFFKDHDLATFDAARGDGGKPGDVPQFVTVVRSQEDLGTADKLICQHLVLQMRHKDSKPAGPGAKAAPPPPAADETALEIETAHATGSEVIVASDAEKLSAQGNDFFYDALQGRAVLKGAPEMTAERAGSTLHARELQIIEVKPPPGAGPNAKGYQEVVALGPGTIDLADSGPERKPAPGQPERDPDRKTTHAYWKDKLTSTRDGPLDVLTLTGAARFVDDEHEQTLQAEVLKVWLTPAEKKDEKARPGGEPKAQPSPRPQHVEALGNVLAHSRELHVHDSSRLVVWFRDVPPAVGAVIPPSRGTPTLVTGSVPPAPAAPPTVEAVIPPAAASRPGPTAPATPGAPAKPAEPDRPIDLSARSVEAWVLRQGERSTLEKLFTEGDVHVKQAPAKPEDRGVEITGKTLQMTYNPAGNYLVVTEEEKLAHLRMDKILIMGPEVNIDQATNKSWVHGSGGMELESTTDFQGGALDHAVPLTVLWNKEMLFKGTEGEFVQFCGDVNAYQENARLTCQSMQVFFDRPVSLKEGYRSDQPARVKRLSCDRGVRVEDTTRQKDRVVKYQLIVCQELHMDALEPEGPPRPDGKGPGNKVHCTGPGSARVFQAGAVDPLAPPPAPGRPPAKPPQEEMKLTHINFKDRMQANSKTNTAKFWGDVRVLSLPSDNPEMEIDLDRIVGTQQPPKGAMYLRCDWLEVFDQPANGRPNQQLMAHERVYVLAEEFSARCDHLYYDQAKDQVILDGERNGATLWKITTPGAKPQELKGKKIIYNRTTGDAQVAGGDSISGDQLPGRR